MTVSCPLDCEYLLEARRHERFEEIPESQMPHRDVAVTEEFLNTRDPLLGFLSMSLLGAALGTPNAIDADVREALAAMIQTLRTSRSGLIYESRPTNPIAAAIQDKINVVIEKLRESMKERMGPSAHIPDTDLLGIFVFLHRVALVWDNKRPRSRSFMSFLVGRQAGVPMPPDADPEPEQTSLLAPPAAGSSLIIP